MIPIKKNIEEIDKLSYQIEALKQDIIEKETELKKRDDEINIIEMRIILEKDKIIKLKEDRITNLTKENIEDKIKVEEIEKENEKLKEENKALTWKGMYLYLKSR